ncbi:MAG: hypothetical protein QM793_08330 [Muricomes sp.]
MKPIKVRPTVINIPFEDYDGNELFTLHFDRSDDNVQNFKRLIPKLEEKIKEIEETPDIDIDEKSFLSELADSFLGEGAFEKIYSINNSVFTSAKYVFQIAVGIKEEFEEEDKRAIFDKYK